jgi:tetratricopeptide (TPR) repeat protein
MRTLLAFILLTLIGISTFGQSNSEIINKAKNLIADKKYDSAFKLLDKSDPKNEIPDDVLLKEEIALNYFVTSIMHQVFGLKDLGPNETISDYRGKPGEYSMVSFPVNEILEKLIKNHPDNYKLYKGLGDFYYEVHLKYGDNWLKNNKELFNLIEKNYSKAINHGEYDYLTYYVLGYISISQEKYKESIPLFTKSIKLDKDYASAYYNLAYAYLYNNIRDSAIMNAKKSLDLYQDRVYKGDAARMVATIYGELNDELKSIEYYEVSNTIDSNNYYTLRPLLNLYVKTGSEKADQTTEIFYNLGPDKPTIYNDLSSIYFENNKSDKLVNFYKSLIPRYESEPKIYGNLNFYLGRLYFDTDKKVALDYFMKSKEIFAKVYKEDHQVFKVINDAIEKLK